VVAFMADTADCRHETSQLCLGVKSFYALPKRLPLPDATGREREELDRSPAPVTLIANRFQALRAVADTCPLLCRYVDLIRTKHGLDFFFKKNKQKNHC